MKASKATKAKNAHAKRVSALSRLDQTIPLNALCTAGLITRTQLAARADVGVHVLGIIAADDDRFLNLPLLKIIQVAHALGVAPAELAPKLFCQRPKGGMLVERGVLKGQDPKRVEAGKKAWATRQGRGEGAETK